MPETFKNRWQSSQVGNDVYADFRISRIDPTRGSADFCESESQISKCSDPKDRSVLLLIDSLRDAGIDDIDRRDFCDSSERVVALVWKLLSDRQRDLRQVSAEKDRHAKTQNDNKMLKGKVTRLVDEVGKLQVELSDLKLQCKKREADVSEKLDTVQRNRNEWEKCALSYKGREKKYVAEIRKQEHEYDKLQNVVLKRTPFSHVSHESTAPKLRHTLGAFPIEDLLALFTELEARVEAKKSTPQFFSVSSLPEHVEVSLPALSSQRTAESHCEETTGERACCYRESSERLSVLVSAMKVAINHVFVSGDLTHILSYASQGSVPLAVRLIGVRYGDHLMPLVVAEPPKPPTPDPARIPGGVILSREKCVQIKSKIQQVRRMMNYSHDLILLVSFLAMSTEALIFETAARLYNSGDAEGALGTLAAERTLLVRLVECALLEELGRLEAAETKYMEMLEGEPCPLGLLHYLQFLARSKSVAESLSFFDDMFLAESEHVTPDLYPAVAITVAWQLADKASAARLAMEVFEKGLSRVKGSKRRAELVSVFADFLALHANELKLAEFEISKFLAGNKHSAKIWKKWEQILIAFNVNSKAIKAMSKLANEVDSSAIENEDELAAQEEEAPPTSYLLNPVGNEPGIETLVAESLMTKFSLPNFQPSSNIIELVLGLPKIGQLTVAAIDLRDGGDGPNNHVLRPDLTQMVKYRPHDFDNVIVPETLVNLTNLLPSNNPLRNANPQYLADQCVKLLLSVAMPPRLIPEETYTNVDKRTKQAVDSRSTKQAPPAALLATTTKEKPDRVKKEEVIDPVEFYNEQKR